jgi:hypothetical protein
MKIDIGESRIMGRGIMLGYDVTEFSQNVKVHTPLPASASVETEVKP